MFYLVVDNQIQCADYKFEDSCKEYVELTMDEYIAHPNKVVIVDDYIIENKNYNKEQEEKEKQRIANLTCTKRVLILMLEELGLDYFNQIQPLIEDNRQAKLEWELASELLRSNPLIDIIGKQLGVSHEQLDLLFRYANGEITAEEFIPTVKEIE